MFGFASHRVKYSINTETNEPCAIKVLDKEQIQKLNMGNQIKKEISIMKMVRHKYIVGMKEVLASKTKIFIVLELVTGGELFDKIVSVGRFNEAKARFYFMQLIEGVEYCHGMGVCHRDLKPENLLLDEHGNLKISDFGLSSLYVGDADEGGTKRTEILHTTCGTPNYVAPEVLADKGYDGKKADAWSIGVILYVLLAGFLPFDENTIQKLFAKIQAADFTYPAWFSPEVRAFLDEILVTDPVARTSVADMKNKPWITSGGVEAPSAATVNPTSGEPTQEMLEAIGEIALDEGNSTNGTQSAGDESDEDEETGKTPKTLNAFGLVNECGGFALGRMFCPKTFMPISDQDEISLLNRHRKTYQFSSPKKAADLFAATQEALKELNFRVVPIESAFKLRATLLTPAKGMIGLSAQVFLIGGTQSLCLLEIRRGKGDLMEFNNVCVNELIDKKLFAAGWINKVANEEEAKDSSS